MYWGNGKLDRIFREGLMGHLGGPPDGDLREGSGALSNDHWFSLECLTLFFMHLIVSLVNYKSYHFISFIMWNY